MLLAKVVYKLCLCPCLTFAQCTCVEQPEVPIYRYSLPHCLQKVHTKPWTTLREHLSFRHTKIIIHITVFWLKVLSYQVFQETGLFIWWVLSMCWCHWTMQPVRNEGWWAVRLHQSFEDTSKTFSSSFRGRWIPHIFCKNYLWHAQSIIELAGHPYM